MIDAHLTDSHTTNISGWSAAAKQTKADIVQTDSILFTYFTQINNQINVTFVFIISLLLAMCAASIEMLGPNRACFTARNI